MTLRLHLLGLRLWLYEIFGLHESETYYRLTREAMGCIAWRTE